jgi:hypothetical protein
MDFMVIIILLFFYMSASFGMQKFSQPNPKRPANKTSPDYPSYYNPSDKGPVFDRPTNNQYIIFEPKHGGDDDNPTQKRQPTYRLRKNPSIVAEIRLHIETDFLEEVKELESKFPFFTFKTYFRWHENDKTKSRLTFSTLEDAIIHAQSKGYGGGTFAIWGTNWNVLTNPKLYRSTKPNPAIHNLSEKPFVLFIITPYNKIPIKAALEIALANSRLRDLYEGCYAIISHFDKNQAHQLSKEDQNGLDRKLLDIATSYCTFKNIDQINHILLEPGDAQYLEKLKNVTHLQFSFKKTVLLLLKLNSAYSFIMLAKKGWLTNKFPFPNSFLQKANLFITLLGTGLLIKNLFQAVEPFIAKQNKIKENR